METTTNALPPWLADDYAGLCQRVTQGRLAHALLLQGPEGIGKLELARHFAHRLLCRSPREDQPCQACGPCRLVAAGTHPDLKLVRPEEKRNAIRVEQIRDTITFMGLTAQQEGRKVVIISPAEAMNVNAANALLKGLEEPAADTVLLLISHHPALLPATVRSRCQALKLVKPAEAQALAWLEMMQVGDAATLLKLADGAPLRARRLADDDTRRERGQLLDSLARLTRGEIDALAAADACSNLSISHAIEGMMLCLADVLRYLQSGEEAALRDADLLPLARTLTGGDSQDTGQQVRRLHRVRGELLAARRALVSNANPNPQLMLESLFLSWSNS